MDRHFHAKCEFVDTKSYFNCDYEIYQPNGQNTQIQNIKIDINLDLRTTDREINKINFIGYCSRGYIPNSDKIINKILAESYFQVCKK